MNESSKTVLRLPFRIYNIKIHHRLMSTANDSDLERNLNNEPQYPPIVDVVDTLRERLWKKRCDWYDKIQKLPTVEQKLIELNMPKYYGFFSVMLSKYSLKSSSLDFLKFATRTEIYNNLPKHYYEKENEFVDEAVSLIKGPVEELIALHFGHKIFREFSPIKRKQEVKDKLANENFLIDLNNILMKYLNDYIPHLPCTSVDLQPRIEGVWFVGGFKPANVIIKRLEGRKNTKEFAMDPTDRTFRSTVRPAIAVRTNHGLPDVIPFDGNFEEIHESFQDKSQTNVDPSENIVTEPKNDYSAKSFKPLHCSPFDTDPKAWGLIQRRSPVIIIPGFWPGVKDEYGHIFMHSREIFKKNVAYYGDAFVPQFLSQHALVDCFTQAMSYGLYQGFTPGSEMTYPIVQQSVSSDGQKFQFALYQLNTIRLHGPYSTDQERINYLWLSEDMPLFESVEGDNVKGLNEDVLRQLCLMYLKKGQPRENPAPYLADYKYIMHHDAPEEYKQEFQNFLRDQLLSHRPRTKYDFMPEILPWEYIYKVKFNTRPVDKKVKYFEFEWAQNPYTRRLDDYPLKYIPKVRRIDFDIKHQPRIHSEKLFQHDWKTLKKKSKLYDDDEIAFKSMNVDEDTPPYYNGLLWRRGINKRKKMDFMETDNQKV